ncbi:MAG: maltotransferase domain-containing protein [Thermoleophilia bacterium]
MRVHSPLGSPDPLTHVAITASGAPPRVRIEEVSPRVDCGRYPAKRTVGDHVEVAATIVRDGPDVVRAVVRFRPPGARTFREQPLVAEGNDRFAGSFEVDRPGRWTFAVEAWTDRLATWRQELSRKAAAAQPDLLGELAEGARLLAAATRRLRGADRELLAVRAAVADGERVAQETRVDAALDEGIARRSRGRTSAPLTP